MRGVLAHVWRWIRILATFSRTGALEEILPPGKRRNRLWRCLAALAAMLQPFGLRGEQSEPPLARAIMALGPSIAKFGQLASTRPDIVGPHLAEQLRRLQERMPPFPMEEAHAIVARETGKDVDAIFTHFGPPVAAASVAQVHPATLRKSGRKVAVKLLRPGIRRAFARDVAAFHFGARWLERLSPEWRRLRPLDVIAHFARVTRMETDMRLEAASMSEYAQNAKGDAILRFPAVHWPLTGRRMLCMEWIEGMALHESATLDAAGVDRPRLAENLLQLFLRHVLHFGFFHADMHPGNIRVDKDGRIILMDFGIMGRLDYATRRHYAQILYGFLERDYELAAHAHFHAGYVPEGTDLALFAHALRAIGDPIHERESTAISMGALLYQLFEVTERFGMETRPELILLQRTMVVVEGVGRTLDPHMNMWQAARPEIIGWMETHLGPGAMIADAMRTLRALANIAPRLPALIADIERKIIAMENDLRMKGSAAGAHVRQGR